MKTKMNLPLLGTVDDYFGENSKVKLEAIGFEFGHQSKHTGVSTQLPEGWSAVVNPSQPYSRNLIDGNGCVRATIHLPYFYDKRDAYITISHYYKADIGPCDGVAICRYKPLTWQGVVFRCGAIIWCTKPIGIEPDINLPNGNVSDDWLAWKTRRDSLSTQLVAWLDENHPRWHDPFAYWDEEKTSEDSH